MRANLFATLKVWRSTENFQIQKIAVELARHGASQNSKKAISGLSYAWVHSGYDLSRDDHRSIRTRTNRSLLVNNVVSSRLGTMRNKTYCTQYICTVDCRQLKDRHLSFNSIENVSAHISVKGTGSIPDIPASPFKATKSPNSVVLSSRSLCRH